MMMMSCSCSRILNYAREHGIIILVVRSYSWSSSSGGGVDVREEQSFAAFAGTGAAATSSINPWDIMCFSLVLPLPCGPGLVHRDALLLHCLSLDVSYG